MISLVVVALSIGVWLIVGSMAWPLNTLLLMLLLMAHLPGALNNFLDIRLRKKLRQKGLPA